MMQVADRRERYALHGCLTDLEDVHSIVPR